MGEETKGKYCVERCPYRTDILREDLDGPYICKLTGRPSVGPELKGFEYGFCEYSGDYRRCNNFMKRARESVLKRLVNIATKGKAE